MRNTTLAATALVALFATPVLAQNTAPSMNPPAATTAPETTGSVTPAHSAGTAAGGFVDAQRSDQWLASNLIGTKVRGAGDENLGSVSDVVLDANGTAVAVVIGVGGFLGVGEKAVAVPFASVEKVRGSDGDRLMLRSSKDELKAAPTFKEYRQPSSSASSGTGSSAPATPVR